MNITDQLVIICFTFMAVMIASWIVFWGIITEIKDLCEKKCRGD